MAVRYLNGFLSTLPARGATGYKDLDAGVLLISIHAPREGSDLPARQCPQIPKEISIHAPREGSDRSGGTEPDGFPNISIHAPREGSDNPPCQAHPRLDPFLSTLPARGATVLTWIP